MDTLTSPKPHLTIQPTAGWQAINLRELWQFRDLLTTLAQRDVKLRYRQTSLGVVWVILQPLISAGIFSFVFGKVAKLPAPHGVPYLVFSYAGLLAWNAFASTIEQDQRLPAGELESGVEGLLSTAGFAALDGVFHAD